jgi:hypothetical protein
MFNGEAISKVSLFLLASFGGKVPLSKEAIGPEKDE